MLNLSNPLESGTQYEIWLLRDDGSKLMLLDETNGFEFVKAANSVGRFKITIPPELSAHYLARDRRVEFMRAPTGSRLRQEFVGFLQSWKWSTTARGVETLTLSGGCPNNLLERRIVAYDAENLNTDMTDEADDMMKAIMVDNFGIHAPAARRMAAAGLTIEADASLGPSISLSFAWRPVLRTLQQIADIAADNGTDVYFGIYPNDNNFVFKTQINQPGMVRTFPIFGLAHGNLERPELEYDYSREVNYVYAAGQGWGSSRATNEQEDTARSGASLWARREAFEDSRHLADSSDLQAAAEGRLEAGKGRRVFTARISDSAGTRYGRDWHWGDRLPVVYRNVHLDAVVTRLLVRVDANGRERLDAGLRAVD